MNFFFIIHENCYNTLAKNVRLDSNKSPGFRSQLSIIESELNYCHANLATNLTYRYFTSIAGCILRHALHGCNLHIDPECTAIHITMRKTQRTERTRFWQRSVELFVGYQSGLSFGTCKYATNTPGI